MPRVLYLIASHTNPDQVVRLVKTIKAGSPHSQVLIHHDYSSSYLNPAPFKNMNHVHVLEDYVSVDWGEFSQVEMELHCINWLIINSVKFDWLVFLSGQDYPIKPLVQIEQFLEETDYDGFMEYFLAEDPPEEPTECGLRWKKRYGRDRYFCHYFKLPLGSTSIVRSVVFRLKHLVLRMRPQPPITFALRHNGASIGLPCSSTPFTPEFQCYAGSQWYTLSYRCIKCIQEFVQHNPEFVEYYQKNTIIPDESFFQTILLNYPELKIVNDNKRYISWSGGRHPNIFNVEDLHRLVMSDKHFARKFDTETDAQVLDLLDQYLSVNAVSID